MTSLPNHQDPPPSGRERALETLIDMDTQGSLYRAAKALVSLSSLLLSYIFYVLAPPKISVASAYDQLYRFSDHLFAALFKFRTMEFRKLSAVGQI